MKNVITIDSKKEKEIIDITSNIQAVAIKMGKKDGFLHLFLKHTTAALTTTYIDSKLELEMIDAFEVEIPKFTTIRTQFAHKHLAAHFPTHVTAAYFGPSLSVPLEKGKLVLGNFQRIVLVELNGPRKREIIIGT